MVQKGCNIHLLNTQKHDSSKVCVLKATRVSSYRQSLPELSSAPKLAAVCKIFTPAFLEDKKNQVCECIAGKPVHQLHSCLGAQNVIDHG